MKRLLLVSCFFASQAFPNSQAIVPSLPNFVNLLRDADSMTVYEGLPHQTSEGQSRYVEMQKKKYFHVTDTGKNFDELFYERPLNVGEEDKVALDTLFRIHSPCVAWTGMKFCGGFHADYAIEWKRKDVRVAIVLLCFGCHELVLIYDDANRMTDLSKDGYESLRRILSKYRQERPPYTRDVPLEAPKPEPVRIPPPEKPLPTPIPPLEMKLKP